MKKKSFGEVFEKAKERDTFLAAQIILEFTEGLYDLMERQNISRVEMAKRLGTSPAYITKILRGDINFTIDSMVRLAKAAGGIVQVHVGPQEITRWVGIVEGQREPLPRWEDTAETQVVTYSNKERQGHGTIPLAA